jgi:parallel beta-helix repeat protein
LRLLIWFLPLMTWAAMVQAEDFASLQGRLRVARPGDVVTIPAGRHVLSRGLSILADGITLRGAGAEKTTLVFRDQRTGGEGILVSGNHVTLSDFAVEDAAGDGIKALECQDIKLQDLRVYWTKNAKQRGDYGVYPVRSRRVQVVRVYARNATEAGIYVGQSEDAVIRYSVSEHNLIGIEVENSAEVTIEHNTASANAVGVLVSNLPEHALQGREVNILRNRIHDNNRMESGNNDELLAHGLRGLGVALIAAKSVRLAENDFEQHAVGHIVLLNFRSTPYPLSSADADPRVLGVRIGANRFGRDTKKHVTGELYRVDIRPFQYDVLWDGDRMGFFSNIVSQDLREVVCAEGEVVARFGVFSRAARDVSTHLLTCSP